MTDRVLPAVPIRQWVLSLPFEIRRLAAFRADVAAAVGRLFVEAIAGELRRELGVKEGARDPAALRAVSTTRENPRQ